ncbi:hypothetical protein L2Y96_09895 [Luteibacter aegosomaticola]|uniref:hypothetical protein n=1 Tax=Luteibacter aegosomaticola TaxID=2911538 RepID=UPI001FF86F3D|nr:hypothetical protein [Luteibacter aegosomaticola]UPG92052.1 hypothetical protein L2Y96_09895 [Luteibacter aegosomaticola]
MRSLLTLTFLAVTPAVFAQTAMPKAGPTPPVRPVSTQASNPGSPQLAKPSSSGMPANPAMVPPQTNPASAPLQPASNAGASERGLAPVQPATGVTPQVRHAANHDTDAEGHTLDPHGKPVGQAPAVPSTVH